MRFNAFLHLIRPWQWLKNLILFFPPALSGALLHSGMAARGILPFSAFCCISSTAYVFNDLADQTRDACHPEKRYRPLPSGQLSRTSAMLVCVCLAVIGTVLSWNVSSTFLVYVVLYLLISVFYSLFLKHLPIVDIFCISLGFVLRLYAGGEAFDVFISDWLFLTVFLLAVFLSVGKRYSERLHLGETAGSHRRALEAYPDGFLDSAMYLSGSAVLVTYAIYAISTPLLVYTVPLCLFGLLRYLFRIKSGRCGDPTEALIKDLPLMVTSILWGAMVIWSVYQ